MFHWTQHNIRVHVFTCVLALQVAHLMRLKARRAGLDLSVRALLGELAGIGETIRYYAHWAWVKPARQRTIRQEPCNGRLLRTHLWEPRRIPPGHPTVTEGRGRFAPSGRIRSQDRADRRIGDRGDVAVTGI